VVQKTLNIRIEVTTTGYHLYIDDWFRGGFKTLRELEEVVAERIRSL